MTLQRGSGPGGQHRNRTDTCVRLKHLPTGIIVRIDGRSQYQNKIDAREILEVRVANFYKEIELQKNGAVKSNQMKDAGRSGKTRTYNFAESRVVDHISNKKTTQIDRVMKGELNLVK
jgi:peptide chain release factor 1